MNRQQPTHQGNAYDTRCRYSKFYPKGNPKFVKNMFKVEWVAPKITIYISLAGNLKSQALIFPRSRVVQYFSQGIDVFHAMINVITILIIIVWFIEDFPIYAFYSRATSIKKYKE
tara:strand:+ start:1052 stop:1396 length:345 start_codon:yes stop_codon:yes gene_type:complete